MVGGQGAEPNRLLSQEQLEWFQLLTSDLQPRRARFLQEQYAGERLDVQCLRNWRTEL